MLTEDEKKVLDSTLSSYITKDNKIDAKKLFSKLDYEMVKLWYLQRLSLALK